MRVTLVCVHLVAAHHRSTSSSYSLIMATHALDHAEEQQTSKRARIDDGAEGAARQTYLPTYNTTTTNDGPSSSAPASASVIPPSSVVATPPPLPVPMSPLLTHTPPAWIAEVPAFLEAIQQHEPTVRRANDGSSGGECNVRRLASAHQSERLWSI
jgi:hypothetical protein